jgi:hypothetical protein
LENPAARGLNPMQESSNFMPHLLDAWILLTLAPTGTLVVGGFLFFTGLHPIFVSAKIF